MQAGTWPVHSSGLGCDSHSSAHMPGALILQLSILTARVVPENLKYWHKRERGKVNIRIRLTVLGSEQLTPWA